MEVKGKARVAREKARLAKEKGVRLSRAHKNFIHLSLIVLVGVSLWHEGGSSADWGFVVLALACEVTA